MPGPSLITDLLRATGAQPGAPAIVAGKREVSYSELTSLVAGFSGQLRNCGVKPGDRVSIFLEKTLESVVALLGTWGAGAIAVPVNEKLRPRQVAHIVRHSGSAVFVSTPRKVRPFADSVLAGTPVLEVELEASSWSRGEELGTVADESDRAAILYTSGSTGAPKGILLSHDNLSSGARIVSTYLEITSRDRILSVLPFSFDYGLNQLLSAVHTGACLILQRSTLSTDICRTLVEKVITGFAGVPPLWIQLADENTSPLRRLSLPNLRYITNTGGAFPIDLVQRYREFLPSTRIFLMYGLTEAFRSTYLEPEELEARPGSMGRAIPETEVLVVDDDDCHCQPGEIGELVHRGPTVAQGYWKDPDATASVFRLDPLDPEATRPVVYSGDLVRTDDSGFLYFVGRRDQMIKSQGYRISPEEVEEIIYDSGLVREVVAKGAPDPLAGQAVVLHCVPEDPASFDEKAIFEHCRREMPRYMLPREICVHESLPRTSSGKVDRKAITC